MVISISSQCFARGSDEISMSRAPHDVVLLRVPLRPRILAPSMKLQFHTDAWGDEAGYRGANTS